jgi:hypothetical protein
MDNKILHRKLKIERHESSLEPMVNGASRETWIQLRTHGERSLERDMNPA